MLVCTFALWALASCLPQAVQASNNRRLKERRLSAHGADEKCPPAKLTYEELEARVAELEEKLESSDRSVGEVYMEDLLSVSDYDNADDSFHFQETESWSRFVEASRSFRGSLSGGVYNYRNKVLMGMAQSRVLNEAPYTTPKEDVVFDVPTDTALPETEEEIMMLSVLEMQSLLRQGCITSVQLTNIALSMLEKYDPEFNMLEVELTDLALRVAAEADALFAEGNFLSPIQGIPFAIKDT